MCGFVVEAKKKEVNWALLGEWTICDQLKQSQREYALPNQKLRPLDMMTLGDIDDKNEGNSLVQKRVGQDSQQSKDRGRLSLGFWTAILASLELEFQNLELELQDCRKVKDQCKVELLKVEL